MTSTFHWKHLLTKTSNPNGPSFLPFLVSPRSGKGAATRFRRRPSATSLDARTRPPPRLPPPRAGLLPRSNTAEGPPPRDTPAAVMATPGSSTQQADASPGGTRRRRAQRRPETADCDGVTEEDCISRLPEDLLLDVLARLNCAREAARTSVLARRWRGLWTRLHELTFHEYDPSFSLADVLAQVTSPSLNLLHIYCGEIPCPYTRSPGCSTESPFHVSSLLRAAERLAPKNLSIHMVEHSNETVELPCFDRTTSLSLCLPNITLTPPPAGMFTALQSLFIETSSEELGSLLPLCPNLDFLHFNHSCPGVLIVHSTSLEELHVDSTDDEVQNIEIVAPLLKEASISIKRGEDFSVSFSAPMVEKLCFEYVDEPHNVGHQNMRLHGLSYYLTHGVQKLHLDIVYKECSSDPDLSFEEDIEQLPFSQFSTLLLYLRTGEHAFGPLVLHLLQIRPVQTLDLILNRRGKVSCPLDCPCDQHTNWRNESISLTELEAVTIWGLGGEDDEADFLKLLFRCATALKSMTLYVAAGGYNKLCGICEQYPHVKCDVSARKLK